MGRIGSLGCPKIHNSISNKNEPAYETNPNDLVGYMHLSEKEPRKLVETSFRSEFELRDNEGIDEAVAKHRGKAKSEYQQKIGSRSTGDEFQNASEKPYIEYGSLGYDGELTNAPNINLLNEKEQFKLKTVYPKSAKISLIGETVEDVGKFDKHPYAQTVIQKANESSNAFIDHDLQRFETSPSTEAGKSFDGSNLKFNYAKQLNENVGPVSTRELYNKTFADRKPMSNIYMKQMAAWKSRAILGLYGKKE